MYELEPKTRNKNNVKTISYLEDLPQIKNYPKWLQDTILWVKSMQIPDSICEFRLHKYSGPTVFASCFALHFFHLCGLSRKWSEEIKEVWSKYLMSFQEKDSGLFVDPGAKSRVTDSFHDENHLNMQLTGFCLSSLRILKRKPRYRIKYIEQWKNKEFMINWLNCLNWTHSSNSGNKSMFIAIMLINELEEGSMGAQKGLDAWFDWHDKNNNKISGYWGSNKYCEFHQGMKGFVHQFIIYNYLGKNVPYPRRVVDRTLSLQLHDGLFAPIPGGGSCDDLDAIHILCYMYHTQNYKKEEIARALSKTHDALLHSQNEDGGFCWAKRNPFKLIDWLLTVFNSIRKGNAYFTYFSLKDALIGLRSSKKKLKTGWSKEGWHLSESTLWDTWFRVLAIAEIETVLFPKQAKKFWTRLEAPNFGLFLLPD